jgi:hypothetical protein
MRDDVFVVMEVGKRYDMVEMEIWMMLVGMEIWMMLVGMEVGMM